MEKYDFKANCKLLQSVMGKLDAIIIPSNDEFFNEYTPISLNRLYWATGFTGSNGVAIILNNNNNVFFTDSRYLLQAQNELPDSFTIKDMHQKESCNIYPDIFKQGIKIGYDPRLHSKPNIEYYERLRASYDFELIALDQNPIDTLWGNRPSIPNSDIYSLGIQFTGLCAAEKLKLVLQKLDTDSFLLTDIPSICWLLNIRAEDIPFNPLVLARCLIHKNGDVTLYTNLKNRKLNLDDSLNFLHLSDISKLEQDLLSLHGSLALDESETSIKILTLRDYTPITNPIIALKAVKNEVEIDGMRQAHKLDSKALSDFFAWLGTQDKSKLTEYDLSLKLYEFRRQSELFVMPSFPSIIGYKENGAIVHYRPDENTAKSLSGSGMLLIDSGGHYLCGTTDITRTVYIGTPSEYEKQCFTYVLKGHIRLAKPKFPKGTKGYQLDALARYDLWQNMKNYGHGTGHGVGCFLSVHEGPQSISSSASNAISLVEGMILSNEPGYYENGKFGIRIENLLLVKQSDDPNFYEFENLTKYPFDHALIDFNILTEDEIDYINNQLS